jgi:hypothetical protein
VELRNPVNGALVWRSTSSQINFQTLLPSATATNIADLFNLPATVAEGTYDVHVIVEDNLKKQDGTTFRPPMALAINGRQTDGSYKLGTVDVVSEANVTSVVTPTLTTTPSVTPNITITSTITTGPTITSTEPTITGTNPTITGTNPTVTSSVPTVTVNPSCPLQPKGDADCDQDIDDTDYVFWRSGFKGEILPQILKLDPDFDHDGKYTLIDFEIWRENRGTIRNNPTSVATSIPACVPLPACVNDPVNPCAVRPPYAGYYCEAIPTPISTDTKITPTPICAARPACLDAQPACKISEPAEGWCPNEIPTPTAFMP